MSGVPPTAPSAGRGARSRAAVQRAVKDLGAGAIFICFGLGFALTARTYPLGTTVSMGPGYFPFVLGVVLVVLGVLVVVKGLLGGEGGEIGPIPIRAIILIGGAIVFFGVTVRSLGLVPALFVAVVMTALASSRTRPVVAVAIAAGLTVLCVLIFIVGLGLRLPVFGPALPFRL